MRRRWHALLLAAASATHLLAGGPAMAGQMPEDVARGRALAERLCARCHLNPGQGEKMGPDGIPGFAAVARRKEQSIEDIIHWLRSVPPMMPDHHLTQSEMGDLAAFILSLRDAKKK